jgi:hypothetical protein
MRLVIPSLAEGEGEGALHCLASRRADTAAAPYTPGAASHTLSQVNDIINTPLSLNATVMGVRWGPQLAAGQVPARSSSSPPQQPQTQLSRVLQTPMLRPLPAGMHLRAARREGGCGSSMRTGMRGRWSRCWARGLPGEHVRLPLLLQLPPPPPPPPPCVLVQTAQQRACCWLAWRPTIELLGRCRTGGAQAGCLTDLG